MKYATVFFVVKKNSCLHKLLVGTMLAPDSAIITQFVFVCSGAGSVSQPQLFGEDNPACCEKLTICQFFDMSIPSCEMAMAGVGERCLLTDSS